MANPQPLEALIWFCPRCFGSSDSSSWGGETCESGCMNCGSGPTLSIPRWAVESIRTQASFVGRRYYPHEEDFQAQEELQDLRLIPKTYPGRTAKLCAFHDDRWSSSYWSVEQKKPDGSIISIMVGHKQFPTKQAALKEARTRLPYVPAKKLKEKK
jgi:hypothetical protein